MPPSGAIMAAEMAEQPQVLRRLAARADEIVELVRGVAPGPLAGVAIVARGSSDHASVVGRYLLELATGRPLSLVAPSLHTLYEARVDYHGQLAIAVSQSGRTPEIVTTLRRLTAAGAAGLAITNDPDSVLSDAEPARRVAATLAEAPRLVVTARGLLYGAALEAALKLQETAGIAAHGFSAADLRHGPIAIVDEGFPVLALSAAGPARGDVAELVAMLRARGARVLTVSTDADADLPLPPVVEPLAPIVAVVAAQQLAHELALARGHDPDAPVGLQKVTAT
jgi:glucosamine--fructose-6-phosphate aminotransferase (isomerizing)